MGNNEPEILQTRYYSSRLLPKNCTHRIEKQISTFCPLCRLPPMGLTADIDAYQQMPRLLVRMLLQIADLSSKTWSPGHGLRIAMIANGSSTIGRVSPPDQNMTAANDAFPGFLSRQQAVNRRISARMPPEWSQISDSKAAPEAANSMRQYFWSERYQPTTVAAASRSWADASHCATYRTQ